MPNVPELFYDPTGKEPQPRPLGEVHGLVVYDYQPTSAVNYFRYNNNDSNKYNDNDENNDNDDNNNTIMNLSKHKQHNHQQQHSNIKKHQYHEQNHDDHNIIITNTNKANK